MNRHTRKQIREALVPLLSSRSENIKLECAKVLLAVEGVWCGESGNHAPTKVDARIGLARKAVYERMQATRANRKAQNRRAYLKGKLRRLKQEQANRIQETNDTKEANNRRH